MASASSLVRTSIRIEGVGRSQIVAYRRATRDVSTVRGSDGTDIGAYAPAVP